MQSCDKRICMQGFGQREILKYTKASNKQKLLIKLRFNDSPLASRSRHPKTSLVHTDHLTL